MATLSIHQIDDWFEQFAKDFPVQPRQSVIQPMAWLDVSKQALAEHDARQAKAKRKVARLRKRHIDDGLSRILEDNDIDVTMNEAEVDAKLDWESTIAMLGGAE